MLHRILRCCPVLVIHRYDRDDFLAFASGYAIRTEFIDDATTDVGGRVRGREEIGIIEVTHLEERKGESTVASAIHSVMANSQVTC